MEETFDIFVGSLLSCATQESVTKLFEKFGKIVKVRVMEKAGTTKGMKYAFVHFSNESAALQAIEEMSDFMYNGVPLQVRKSDRWLQRLGEDKTVSRAKTKRLQQGKVVAQSSSSGTIGVWQPPNTSAVPILGSQQTLNSYAGNVQIPTSGTQVDNAVGKGVKETIAVTHVDDLVTFYAYMASKNAELESLTLDLQNLCPTLDPVCGEPVETQVYATMYSVDNQWYRCKVLKVDKASNRSLVKYVDFGNGENVCNSSLVELSPRLQIVPPFSVKCVLRNLAAKKSDAAHYEKGLAQFKALVIDHMVSATVHVMNDESLQVSEIFYDGLDVLDTMFNEGYLVRCINTDNNNSNYVSNNRNNLIQGMGSENVKKPVEQVGNLPNSSYSTPKLPNSSYSTPKLPSSSYSTPKLPNSSQNITKPSNSNNNNSAVTINQEKAQLEAENKKLKHELSKMLDKYKTLQGELEVLNRNLVKPNIFTELPDVICNIEKVRLFRQQLPVRADSIDYIDNAVNLLKDSQDTSRPFSKNRRKVIQDMVDEYNEIQQEILNCTDKEEQSSLITERNDLQGKLHQQLTAFSSAVLSNSLSEKGEAFKVALRDLDRTYHPFAKIQAFGLSAVPVEELHNFYLSMKTEKAQEFSTLHRKTNLAHRDFFKALQPSSQGLDDSRVENTEVSDVTRVLSTFKSCLEEEIRVCSLEETSEACTVAVLFQLLREKLEQELVEMQETSRLERQYSALLEDLSLGAGGSSPPAIEQLIEKRKERKKLKSRLRHILADKMDLEENEEASDTDTAKVMQRLKEVHRELHRTFLEEDNLIASIAHLQAAVFPELNNLYPDFGLLEYNKYKGLVKPDLEIEHFDLKPFYPVLGSEVLYSSVFMDRPIRLQEFQVATESEKQDLLQKVLEYAALSELNLLPVEAVFFTKKGVHAYIQQPFLKSLESVVESSDLSVEEMIQILRDILEGLCALHSRALAHCRLHPCTVYLRPDRRAVLDSIPFQPKSSESLPPLNGIQFQLSDGAHSSSISSDIYSFACICLWLMYPETEFCTSPSGRPVLQDLQMDVWRANVTEFVLEVFDSKTPTYQASDILQHEAFQHDLNSFQLLEVPQVPDIDSCDIITNQKNCSTWNCENDYNKTVSEGHTGIKVLHDLFNECVRREDKSDIPENSSQMYSTFIQNH